MKNFIIILLFAFCCLNKIVAQGCIPVRSINGFGQYNFTNNSFSSSAWQLNFTNRYFQSSRDFKETIDQKTAAQNKSENDTYTLDMSVSKTF